MTFEVFVLHWWQFLLVAVGSFLIGGINFAILFTRRIKHADIRSVGSGNAGTTNVFRVFGLGLGALTFLCDALKGVLVCILCRFIFEYTGYSHVFQCCAGLFAVLGHIFPAYHKFSGGKGVATSIGVCFCVQPLLSLCCILPCIATILITDRMSVMSMLLAVFMIVWHWTVLLSKVGAPSCVLLTAMFCLVLLAHRENIVRLARGKELPTGVRGAIFGKKDKKQ